MTTMLTDTGTETAAKDRPDYHALNALLNLYDDSGRAKLTNTADLIRLIIRDEAVHGYYIGTSASGLSGKPTRRVVRN